MITCVIPYYGNKLGLVSLLTALQPQLHPEDDIYIIDSSPDRSGLAVANMFGTTRCYIFVEVGRYTYEEARIFGIESAVQNGQMGVLVISDMCFISQTFIANLKKAIQLGKYSTLVPKVVKMPTNKMDTNFTWFNPPTKEIKDVKANQVFCYFVTGLHGVAKTGMFENETVVVLPYTTRNDKVN